MRRLVSLVAASTGSLANPTSMASRLQAPASTVKRYLDLLDLLFITRRIPAWSSSPAIRAVATPKLLLNDPGLAAHLTGMSLKRARHPAAPVGPLIETFVLGELSRQLAFTDQPVRLYHCRDRDQYEVDAILESATGDIIACEVKPQKPSVLRTSAASSGWPASRRPARSRDRALCRRGGPSLWRPAPRLADIHPMDPCPHA